MEATLYKIVDNTIILRIINLFYPNENLFKVW